MSTPPRQPGQAKGSTKESLEQQLDALLSQIETAEPGTLDPAVLPSSFLMMESIAAKSEPSDISDATHPGGSSNVTDAEIDELLNAPPAASVSEDASPRSPDIEPDTAAEATSADAEQADMLASLNAALQGLPGAAQESEANNAASQQPPASAEAQTSRDAGDSDAEPMSMEDKLQQEIASLMQSAPGAAESAEPATDVPADLPTDSATQAEDFDAAAGGSDTPEALVAAATVRDAASAKNLSTEDQIAMEIEGLLKPDANAEPAEAPAAPAPPEAEIDELDKMLAEEIDADEELAGDFQSVEELTAGIQIDDAGQGETDDHAATAREVAAELDSQPEDLPAAASSAAPDADPLEVLSEIAKKTERQENRYGLLFGPNAPDWQHWLDVGRAHSLKLCYALNWPARRFLSKEYRETLGHISIIVACSSTLFLLAILLFG